MIFAIFGVGGVISTAKGNGILMISSPSGPEVRKCKLTLTPSNPTIPEGYGWGGRLGKVIFAGG